MSHFVFCTIGFKPIVKEFGNENLMLDWLGEIDWSLVDNDVMHIVQGHALQVEPTKRVVAWRMKA